MIFSLLYTVHNIYYCSTSNCFNKCNEDLDHRQTCHEGKLSHIKVK